MYISVKPLLDIYEISSAEVADRVFLEPKMSGIEDNPRNDWLYVALSELLRHKCNKGDVVEKAGFVGSANGVDVIAALRIFRIRDLTVTDIVPDILPGIERNIRENVDVSRFPGRMSLVVGRDAEPLDGGYDLIYGNLPLIMVSESELRTNLATTTLTDASAYLSLSKGADDLLLKWSLLPQLGFLLSAKNKLKDDGVVITLIGGRVPDEAIAECFERAGMHYERGTVAVMRQSDEAYVKEYADYERELGDDTFLFYDEEVASDLLAAAGEEYPSIVKQQAEKVRAILKPAALSAADAWAAVQEGRHIAHLAYGFHAFLRT